LKNKFEFLWQKGVQPSEIDRMPYWEFECYILYMNEKNKEENDRNKEENDNHPKMPTMPNIKMPTMPNMPSMPKY
jgi:hypothetical protein